MGLTNEQIASVKARGFLINRGTECFSGRVVSIGGAFGADALRALATCAERYGNGTVIFTSRLCAEIVGIPYDRIEEAEQYLLENGLYFGGTGAKVRPVTACKGTTCIFGNVDTHAIAKEIHERFYIGMADVKLPHKFKIGVGGCPNSCMKPNLNDVGIEGWRTVMPDGEKRRVCRVFVGGTWGKTRRMGTQLQALYLPEQVGDVVEQVLLWYRENGYVKERLGATLERLGVEALEAALASGDLLRRKDDILKAPLKEKLQKEQ